MMDAAVSINSKIITIESFRASARNLITTSNSTFEISIYRITTHTLLSIQKQIQGISAKRNFGKIRSMQSQNQISPLRFARSK